MQTFSYRDYVTDSGLAEKYSQYQRRYAANIRESDKVMIERIGQIARASNRTNRPLSLLDIGCSTGNLLLHLKQMVPGLELTGADMMVPVLEECRRNPDLEGIRFEEMNMLDLGLKEEVDIITANAVLYMFHDDELDQALRSVSEALRPNGWFIVYDFFHPYEQDLAVLEKSRSRPDGLMLHFRPFSTVRRRLEDHGFAEVDFKPFEIPIDLEKGTRYTDNSDGFEDLNSYTVKSDIGARYIFRGSLFTPWCHMFARKSA